MKNILKHFYIILSFIAAVCFTAYTAMDTFVIERVYQKVDQPNNSVKKSGSSSDSSSETDSSSDQAEITDTSYTDDNITIKIETYRENDTDIYVADIQVSSPEYLKTAFAKAAYGKNVTATTSDTADSVGAILAINGDYYGVQESGYVLRNGVIYRSTAKDDQEDLVIYEDGTMKIVNEDDVTAEELLENGAYNVLSFGPGLIEDGEISVSSSDEVAKAMTSNPRTAIGIIDDLHYVFVVSDGRTSESEGLTLYQLAEFMDSLGVETAYNLDGGGSSTMVFNGNIINVPVGASTGKKSSGSAESSERSVSDIVYIGY